MNFSHFDDIAFYASTNIIFQIPAHIHVRCSGAEFIIRMPASRGQLSIQCTDRILRRQRCRICSFTLIY